MHRELRFTPVADEQYNRIKNDSAQKGVLKQVRKTIGHLETNLRAKSLQTHKYESLTRRYKREVFVAYVQQNTPAAYRVFWHYGGDEIDKDGEVIPIITIIDITPHPD